MTSYWRSIVTMALSDVVSERNIGTDSQFSPNPPLFDAPWRRTATKFPNDPWYGKTRMMGLPDGQKRFKIGLAV